MKKLKENKTTNRGGSVKELTTRRYLKLKYILQKYNIDVTGNPEFPSLLYQGDKLLFTHIKNFNLSFLEDYPSTGYKPETLFKHRITFQDKDVISENNQEFNIYLNRFFKKVYLIKHQETDLFLTGYSVDTEHPGEDRVLKPVFGTISKKFYIEKSYAENVINKYPELPLEII